MTACSWALPQLFTGVLTILGTLGVMISIDWRIALVVVALTPLSIFVARFIATHTYSMFKVQSETRAEMTSLVEELVGNEHLVRAFGYESRAEARFDRINRDLQKCGVRAVFFSSLTNPCTRFVNSLVYAAVGVLGAFAAIAGAITVGELTVFLNYANQYTKPFNDISDVMTELQNALACAQRVFDLIDETPIQPDASDAVVLPAGAGSVEFEHVKFRYTPDVPLIEDMNLRVWPGQRIALVGPTGCGQNHAGESAHAVLRDQRRLPEGGRSSHRHRHPGQSARQPGHGAAGNLAEIRHHRREHCLRKTRRHPGGDRGGRQTGPCPQLYLPAAQWL